MSAFSYLRTLAVFFVLGCLLSWSTFADAAPAAFRVEPPPKWITALAPANPDEHAAPPAETITNGLRTLLFDRQVRVGARTVETYVRSSRQITNEAGLRSTSPIRIDFDPSYQALAIHSIAIRRGSTTAERLDPAAVRIVQREPNLDQQIFDGTQSAVIFVDDVRVGDVVDYAFTLRGADPTLGGVYDDVIQLGAPEPVERLHARLLLPSARRPHFRSHGPPIDTAPAIATSGDVTEYEWDLRDVKAYERDEGTPSWVSTSPWLQVSELGSWSEVASWGARLFDPRGREPRGPLAEWVARTRRSAASEDDFVLAALRFVQDEVRYVGIETGMARRQPNDPNLVFQRRYGDCKDKSALLVAILRAAGVRAVPALVSASEGRWLEESAPTPSAFDHAIVRITTASGATLWADPTIALQGGGLERLRFGRYVRALPLAHDVAALAPVPERQLQRPSPSVHDHFTVMAPDPSGATGETSLDSERRYEDEAADAMRASLRGKSQDQRQKDYLELFRPDFPGIRERAPLEIDDDRGANVIRVILHYALPQFWSAADKAGVSRAEVTSRLTEQALSRPPSSSRTTPYSMPFPLRVKHTIDLDLPFELPFKPQEMSVRSPAFDFSFESRYARRRLTYDYDLVTRAASVAPADLGAHVAQVDKVRASLARAVTYRAPLPEGINWIGVLALIVGAPFIALGAFFVYRYEPPASMSRAHVDPRLSGISGWLVLLAIAVALNPLFHLANLVTESRTVFSLMKWRAFTTPELESYSPALAIALLVEELCIASFVAYSAVLAILFFQCRRSFPLHFTIFAICLLLFGVLDRIGVAALRKTGDGKPEDLAPLVQTFFWALIWVSYLRTSKRAAATFVRTRVPPVAAIAEAQG